MNFKSLRQFLCVLLTLGASLAIGSVFSLSAAAATDVVIQATPDGGVQPRITVDNDGNIHLLYFKKRLRSPEAREGNLYYRQYSPEQKRFSLPVRVSSQAFNMPTFSIGRASVAIDGEGRIHALWYLPRQAEYIYTRSNIERTQFEPQRSMVTEFREGIDATADVAAHGNQVAIVWGAGDLSREDERTVFARLSEDSGASFGPEMSVGNPDLGACACCSLATNFVNSDIDEVSDLLVAYRSAIDGIGRHMQLLTLDLVGGVDVDGIHSASYAAVHQLQEWELSSCPLSTNDISIDSDAHRWLVFETKSRIVQLDSQTQDAPTAIAEPFTETRQKNPAIAFNAKGERLVVWGEAISHARGGRLNLRLFDSEDQIQEIELEEAITIPNYSFPAAASLPNGDFLVLY